ncbi:aspartyl-phosphate phosphatase Spo0E family protein [Sporolactobacillus sp. STCC-11]|uniref:Spo0E family sporulation regulatory protein-aspartic acid phosphatase n=1 Tax=Sporolactobacillus caesalpiniae TaxID=3230362 RepID=UPI00339AC3A8
MSEFPVVCISQEISTVYSKNIEKKRQELLNTAKHYGLYAEQTLRCSQELDLLIIEVQEKHSPSLESAQI